MINSKMIEMQHTLQLEKVGLNCRLCCCYRFEFEALSTSTKRSIGFATLGTEILRKLLNVFLLGFW